MIRPLYRYRVDYRVDLTPTYLYIRAHSAADAVDRIRAHVGYDRPGAIVQIDKVERA